MRTRVSASWYSLELGWEMWKARWDSNWGRRARGVLVRRRISSARDGEREAHFSEEVGDARIAWKDVRAWEEESETGTERYRGVWGYVSGVEAVDDGDDRGLEADEATWSSSIFGTQTCWPVGERVKWPRSWVRYFGFEVK